MSAKIVRRWLIPSFFVLTALSLAGLFGSAIFSHAALSQQRISLELVTNRLDNPVLATHAGDGSGRLFIVEQTGAIWIFRDGALSQRPFLDVEPLISCCGERGLLGLAFHPRYEENGFFYINYTNIQGDTIIARYQVSADPDVADPTSARTLMEIDQPFANHNGGHLAFGPDGFLYIGMGDGGSGGDPLNSGQSLQTRLGKMHRIDVDAGSPYTIPPDNPFVGQPNRVAETWAYGLRNPWRFSFDRETGDLYIGDVGQGQWEEIDFQPAGSPGGQNYGWRIMEGLHCFNPSTNCNQMGLTLPIHEYSHSQGNCSVTGGYVYRGSQIPGLVGTYIFGDYCTGTIWGLKRNASGVWERTVLLDTNLNISSFGEDEAGEVYVCDLPRPANRPGAVYRIR
jgi:glucose/arabinose dehydrogenase